LNCVMLPLDFMGTIWVYDIVQNVVSKTDIKINIDKIPKPNTYSNPVFCEVSLLRIGVLPNDIRQKTA